MEQGILGFVAGMIIVLAIRLFILYSLVGRLSERMNLLEDTQNHVHSYMEPPITTATKPGITSVNEPVRTL